MPSDAQGANKTFQNPYEDACQVEREGMTHILPYIRSLSPRVQVCPPGDQLALQKFCGDLILKNPQYDWVEVKCEKKNKHRNLYLESWSNRPWARGWMDTSHADKLWWYFVADRHLFQMDFRELREWAYGSYSPRRPSNILRFPEKPQKERPQRNNSWGWCVPIAILLAELKTFCGPIDLSRYVPEEAT